MTDQTKAQRLAELAHAEYWPSKLSLGEWAESTAAELLRLDANEAALLEALHSFVVSDYIKKQHPLKHKNARALITRIDAERNAK